MTSGVADGRVGIGHPLQGRPRAGPPPPAAGLRGVRIVEPTAGSESS
ncbi:hypothetical protein OG250_35600 [Streptomyces sp. NBC_00487]|nr:MULTISPECIES: hypothetical protein [unclassified Streptomyces]